MRLIINEMKFIEDVLETHEIPDDITRGYVLKLIGKYLFSADMTKKEYVDLLNETVRGFNFSSLEFEEYTRQSTYAGWYKLYSVEPEKAKIRSIDTVGLYQGELDIINSLSSDRHKKLLATVYLITRLMGDTGWYNLDYKFLFKTANISATCVKQAELIADLFEAGVAVPHGKNSSLSFKVEPCKQGEIVFEVDEMKNIGNKFTAFIKPDYVYCKNCGKVFKRKTSKGRTPEYCDKCKEEVNKQRTLENYHNNKA